MPVAFKHTLWKNRRLWVWLFYIGLISNRLHLVRSPAKKLVIRKSIEYFFLWLIHTCNIGELCWFQLACAESAELHVNIYTNILEVNLFAFACRLFHEDFSPIYGARAQAHYHLWCQNKDELHVNIYTYFETCLICKNITKTLWVHCVSLCHHDAWHNLLWHNALVGSCVCLIAIFAFCSQN